MLNQNRFLFFLLLAVGWVAMCPSSSALIPRRDCYAEVSPDGSRILVLWGREVGSRNSKLETLPDGRTVDFPKQFPKSGIYDLGSFNLVAEWECMLPSLNMLWNDDFSSVVVLNEHAAHYLGDWALGFVRDGKLIKSYECDELLTALSDVRRMPFDYRRDYVDWHDENGFRKNGSRVTVATASRRLFSHNPSSEIGFQEFYEFDFETGEMLSQRIENTKFKTIVSLIGIFIALVVGTCIWIGKILWKRRFRAIGPS